MIRDLELRRRIRSLLAHYPWDGAASEEYLDRFTQLVTDMRDDLIDTEVVLHELTSIIGLLAAYLADVAETTCEDVWLQTSDNMTIAELEIEGEDDDA